jgi:integral membrane protein
VPAALTRYRIIAYVVGTALVLLTIGVVLKYGFAAPVLVETVGRLHGFLYMAYLVAVFDLGRRLDWPLRRMILVMLAGTVPLLSFHAERVVTGWVQRPIPADAATVPAGEPR